MPKANAGAGVNSGREDRRGVALKLDCTVRTVERKLRLIREILEEDLEL